MKIRTDFVTNSSSSCFCVSLKLAFDNDQEIYFLSSSQNGDMEGWMDCVRNKGMGNVSSWNIGKAFSDIVAARDNISELKDAVYAVCRKKIDNEIKGAHCLRDAELRLSSCVTGEFSYESETYNMLGLKNISDQQDKAIKDLRRNGYTCYTDDALKTIVESEEHEEESRTIIASMNNEGKIDVQVQYNEGYDSFGDANAPMETADDERAAEILKYAYVVSMRFVFACADKSGIEKELVDWVSKEKQLKKCVKPYEKGEVTIFEALGFRTEEDKDGCFALVAEDIETQEKLNYTFGTLVSILAKYAKESDSYAELEDLEYGEIHLNIRNGKAVVKGKFPDEENDDDEEW